MRQLQVIVGALVLALLAMAYALSSRALGHAFPVRSEPRVGSTMDSSPSKVRIWFDGKLEPAFSTLTVYNLSKQQVDKRNGRVNPSDATLLETDVPVLPPGTYRVYWSAVSVDTHRTEGDFVFTIRGASP